MSGAGSRLITLRVTVAQLRMINSALAREEAEDHGSGEGYRPDVMERTRVAVQNAMRDNGIEARGTING